MAPLYHYEPLPASCHTRVLELLPSPNQNDEIRGCLRDIDIYRDYNYQALSYTWGDEPFTEMIVLSRDGREDGIIMIKPNLRDALVRFRSRYEVVRIWIDALCINQGDVEEKARQIPIMDQIYRTAAETLVWLGNHHREGSLLKPIDTASRRLDNLGVPSELYQQVQEVLILPWFTRRWIVQEVVLSTGVHLYCGPDASISWDRFLAVVLHILQHSPAHGGLRVVQMMAVLCEAHRGRHRVDEPRQKTKMLDVLSSFSMLGCENPRDRIFALAGLASDVRLVQHGLAMGHSNSQIVVQVDYKRSVEDIYIDFAAGHTNSPSQFGRVLQVASQRSTGEHLDGKGSWAPDWRLAPSRRSLSKNGINFTKNTVKFDPTTKGLFIDFCPPSYEPDVFGGYIAYSHVNIRSENFPSNASDGGVATWVRQTWDVLKKSTCSLQQLPKLSEAQMAFLLTQFERLVTEVPSSPWMKHANGTWLDTFRSSAEFRRMVLGDRGSVYVPSASPELFQDIRTVMTGRRLLLATIFSPDSIRRSIMAGVLSKVSSLFSAKQQQDTPQQGDLETASWPVIAIGPSHTQARDVLCASTKVEVQCIPNDFSGLSYSYYEHLGETSCILRPYSSSSTAHSASTQQHAASDGSTPPKFWYIGEVKSYRLYEPAFSGKYDQKIQERAIAQHQNKLTSIVLC